MKLVFATHNAHKIKEIKPLLPDAFTLLSLEDIGCEEEILETANTIAGNALIKASYIKKNYGLDCFADDTGLEVKALDGAPGVHSARYAGTKKSDEANMGKLLKHLKNKKDRTAQFKTVVALALGNRQKTFTGICKGEILTEKRGKNGFGYDPIFQPKGYKESFAQMAQEEKNKISHRSKAINKLMNYLDEENSSALK